jgi:hypothetical protein
LIEHYEHELPLTSTSYNDPKLHRSAKKHFGSWRRAVESLGLGGALRREWTKQSVIEAILYRRAAGLSLYTTYQQDRGLFYAAVRRFGSWHLAPGTAGRWYQVSPTGTLERREDIAAPAPRGPDGHSPELEKSRAELGRGCPSAIWFVDQGASSGRRRVAIAALDPNADYPYDSRALRLQQTEKSGGAGGFTTGNSGQATFWLLGASRPGGRIGRLSACETAAKGPDSQRGASSDTEIVCQRSKLQGNE